MEEFFKINGVDVGFASHPTEDTVFTPGALDTEVLIRKGKLRINLLTPALELKDELHLSLLDDPTYDNKRKVDYLRLTTYYDLAVPGAAYDTQIACPYIEGHTGFEAYGLPESAKFHGQIDIQKGYVHIRGELRNPYNEKLAGTPIEVIKGFEPKPLVPPRTKLTWEQALTQPPEDIYELAIGEGIFEEFPKELLGFHNLESLWMGGKSQLHFSSFPEAFFSLPHLHTLQVYQSDIAELPETVSQGFTLEELTIQSSKLTRLPSSICQLPHLTHLGLRYNQLTELPEELGAMPALQSLDILGNRFKQLSPSLNRIPRIQVNRKHRKLFSDLSYPSNNPNPIDETLFNLSTYPESRKQLEEVIDAQPEIAAFKDLIVDHSSMATYLAYREEKKSIPLGSSKVGGSPDLPKGWTHPADKNGALYIFHAQINCEEIAPYQSYLPRKGILYFFVNDEEYAQKAKVLYAENTSELVPNPYTAETKFSDFDYNGNYREAVAVGFESCLSLPHFYNLFNHGSERFPAYAHLFEGAEENDELYDQLEILEYGTEKLEKAFRPPLAFDNGHIQLATHSINSSVFTQHESPQERAAARYGGEPYEWMVLLCMESVGALNFWDAGTLTYCIHKKDLAIQNFETIHTSIESS